MKPCKESSWRARDEEGYYRINSKTWGYKRLHRYLYAKHHKIELTSTDIIRHICSNPSCIELEHLALGTQKENVKDSIDAATRHTKLTKEDIKKIRKLYGTTDLTQQEIAVKFNVSISTISMAVNRRTWKHVRN